MDKLTVAQFRSLEALMVYTARLDTTVGMPLMRPSLSMLRPSGKSGVTSHERTSAPNCSTSKGAIVALTGKSNSVSVSTR